MNKRFLLLCIVFAGIILTSCNNDSKSNNTTSKDSTMNIKEDKVDYKLDTASLHSFVAYDANKEGKRPAVLVVHEWWGLNDYIHSRINQLAALGYVAMAVDMYGDNKVGNDVAQANALATPFYSDPQLTMNRFMAAYNELIKNPLVDTSNMAAIGYCFGGSVVLNVAKLGADLNGVVSFHGGLAGVPPSDKLKAKVLVCHGADDQFVSPAEVAQFKKSMDSVKADYTFVAYPGATHAFTNPQATEWGKKFNIPVAYNAAADTASWKEMKDFFAKIFK